MSNGIIVTQNGNGASISVSGLGGGGTGSSFQYISESGNNILLNANTIVDTYTTISNNGVGSNVIFSNINHQRINITEDSSPPYPMTIYGISGDNFTLIPLRITSSPLLLNPNAPGYGGNVGIGNFDPQYLLDVNGDIGNSNGDLTFRTSTPNILFISPDNSLNISTNPSYVSLDCAVQPICLNAYSSTFVGINTFTPLYQLDINGLIGNSQGNNTGSFIDLSNDYLVDGTGITSVDWNNRILVDSSGNTVLYWKNGNIGIGNSNPFYSLDITGVIGNYINGLIEIGQADGARMIVTDSSENIYLDVNVESSSFGIGISGGSQAKCILFGDFNQNELARFNANGYFGIHNNNPQYTLDVSGSGNFSSSLSCQSFISSIIKTTGVSSYNVNSSNSTILISGQKTITLPSASSVSGMEFVFKQIAIATGTISGSNLIDGVSTYVLTGKNNAVTIQSDGSNWWILNKI